MNPLSESKAKRKRKKLLRQKGLDVTTYRGTVSFSTHERKTKTKKETIEKSMKKHKKPLHIDE